MNAYDIIYCKVNSRKDFFIFMTKKEIIVDLQYFHENVPKLNFSFWDVIG